VGTSVSIGRPISNTRAYVLDRHRNPVPIGIEGDLYLGGDGLARGYLNDAEMTAEKFLDDPFDTRPAARMYHTGDRVRWLADGKLEFLGRRDQQVKIRGFRVELGELEAALSEHPALHMAVALAVGDGIQKRLIAYVTPAAGAPMLSEVQQFLRRRLPDYMLPAAVVALDELPLTPQGKVDRATLAKLQVDPEAVAPYEPPESDVEVRLAEIWAEALGADRVGRHDNFFALGGHSLIATQIVSRVEDAFGAPLPIGVLFEEGTIAAMAKILDDDPQTARAAAAAKLRAQIDRMDPAQIQTLLEQKRASPTTRQTASHTG
jgi:acyl carrier protein